MSAVLGIDAAWTNRSASGVALVENTDGKWRCVKSASSYQDFNGCNSHQDLLTCGSELTKRNIQVIAVDMPLAKTPITGRRIADQAVSLAFGHAYCSTHSPNPDRPGRIGVDLHTCCERNGFGLATDEVITPALIEVYPHPAILTYLHLAKRLPYKVQKARKYWPDLTPDHRRLNILSSFSLLYGYLTKRLGPLDFALPDTATSSELKKMEDRLDAITCAVVGIDYLEGKARPYGNSDAAIWIPH